MPGHQAHDEALHVIDMLLHVHGTTTTGFDLPEPQQFDREAFTNRALRHALAFDRDEADAEASRRLDMLNSEQRAVFDAVQEALDAAPEEGRARAFYVDGPGGSGKTSLYEALIHQVHSRSGIALACAMSGIAATLLPGGTTAHSLFGLPLEMPERDATSSIRAQEARGVALRRAQITIWDESSTIPLRALDCVDRLLRDVVGVDCPFGGKVFLLGGDVRQNLPVVVRGTEEDVVRNTILHHHTMRYGTFAKFSLTEHMRLQCSAQNSTSHREWLLRLGEGTIEPNREIHPQAVPLPEYLCLEDQQPPEALIDWAYPNIRERARSCLNGD